MILGLSRLSPVVPLGDGFDLSWPLSGYEPSPPRGFLACAAIKVESAGAHLGATASTQQQPPFLA